MVKIKRAYMKKVKLAVHGRRTKWAPVWAVLKKHGKGKVTEMNGAVYHGEWTEDLIQV
jgi:hypothetical protein